MTPPRTPLHLKTVTAPGDPIDEALMRVQNAFLADHALTIDVAQASGRFGLSVADCEAILSALLRRGVVAKTPEGGYVRFFPRLAAVNRRGGCPASTDPWSSRIIH
jgi:hypothetical protein